MSQKKETAQTQSNEKSCGAVVFTRVNGKIQYLIIKSIRGIYGFPKGHVEPLETEEQTALREVFEEVGVSIKLIEGFRAQEEYFIDELRKKRKLVVYFLGELTSYDVRCQKSEISDAQLLDYDSAINIIQFESTKKILIAANGFLAKTNLQSPTK